MFESVPGGDTYWQMPAVCGPACRLPVVHYMPHSCHTHSYASDLDNLLRALHCYAEYGFFKLALVILVVMMVHCVEAYERSI